MSYAAFLALISGKRPVWLYDITRGADSAKLTGRKGGYALGAETFTESAIRHSRIKQTSRISAATVTLTFPATDTFARKFLDPLGLFQTSVHIRHGFANDTDQEFVTKFRGRVVGVKPGRTTIQLECENLFTALRRNGLSRVMQRPCPHALYGPDCGLSLAAWQVAGTATAITGQTVTVTEAAAQANGYYSGGLLTYGGASQMVTGHSGTALKLLAPVPGLEDEITANGTAAVQIAPGCPRTTYACDTRFGNLANFGGFPWMGETPFDGRSIV